MEAIAIVKPISVRQGKIAGLKAVLDYISDESKTNDGTLVFGWNCDKERAFRDMAITKNLYDKTTGRQYAHFIQSFDPRDAVTTEMAYRIGREYISSMEKWRDFQVLMAVHTNEEHMHIHYVINSVNTRNGAKWQCSKQDLQHFREQSDDLCRKYNLHVIERAAHGHRSYGENAAYQKGAGWKTLLATDIAECLRHAKSKSEFLHRLAERNIDVDFGTKNVMFTVKAGTYGLTKDMICSNYKLRSYGDFSRANITNSFKLNKGLLELAMDNIPLLQDAFLAVGKMLSPNSPTHLQDLYFSGTEIADFDRLTREEIETYLKQKQLEQIQKKALAERDTPSQSNGLLLASVADTLELAIDYWDEQQVERYVPHYEQESEYEL